MRKTYDLAGVGAGILGQACAPPAARSGRKVVVIDRDAQANGASVRNFGFVTVTGQQRGDCWRRAMRSRDVWDEIAAPAGIPIVHQGLLRVAGGERAQGVDFLRNAAALDVTPEGVATSRGAVAAGATIVCAGDDFHTLFAGRIAPYHLTRCKLQMMRARSNVRLSRAVMTDLSLVRYLGYAELAEAAPLRALLEREQGAHLAAGVHLIVVGAADG